MYVIRVEEPTLHGRISYGFYTKCYQATVNGEKGTWIDYARNKEDYDKVTIFKTYTSAANKLKFLQDKIDHNAYMYDWNLTIVEIGDDTNIVKY